MSDQGDTSVPRRLSIWVWPAVAVAVVAVAGHVFGVLGALVSAASASATLLFATSELFWRERRGAFAVGAVVAAVAVTALFAWQGALPWSRVSTAEVSVSGGPLDLRGRRVTQADIDRSDLRGALLVGADLSSLDLRHRVLDGATAPGIVLRGAQLDGASLQRTDLRGADLVDACLTGADLRGAELDGVRTSGSGLTAATIAAAPPSAAPGIGPSAAPASGCAR